MTTTFPAIDISKIPMGSLGVGVDQLRSTTEQPSTSSIGAFRTVCGFSHMAFDDPIVYPGQPGKSHLHAFFGNTGVNANSTADSIASTGNSTCRGGTVNRTGYWVPAMIDTQDGTPVKPDSMIVYYKTGYRGVIPADVQPFPVGLRMIAGDPNSAADVSRPTGYSCVGPSGSSPRTAGVPTTCPVGSTIWAKVAFPQCWDGVNLDSPDHRSHMAYATVGKGCVDPTHPIALPEIAISVLYTVRDAAALPRWRLSSDTYDPGLPGGFSMHADWFNGWKPDIMNAWITGCDQPSKDCKAHLIGDGRMMY